jgi:cytochrome c oxidase subunit 2
VAVVHLLGSLSPKGPAAREIEELWWLLVVGGGVALAVVCVLLVRAMLQRRATAGPEPLAEPEPVSPRVTRALVVGGGVVLSAVLLVGVFAASLAATVALEPDGDPPALVIEVVAHQYWWEVRYPEAGVTLTDEVRMPAATPVELRLSSVDVIHSFWVPELHGKLDMLPERVNTLVVEADAPGTFRGQCAEFCGLHHARMRLVVVAQPAAEFDAWLQAESGAQR